MPEPTTPPTAEPKTAEELREEEMRAVTIGKLQPLASKIQVVDYDPEWPALFEREAARVTSRCTSPGVWRPKNAATFPCPVKVYSRLRAWMAFTITRAASSARHRSCFAARSHRGCRRRPT